MNIVSIAEESDGLTGADLHNLCNTAGLLAMRELMVLSSRRHIFNSFLSFFLSFFLLFVVDVVSFFLSCLMMSFRRISTIVERWK